VRLSQVRLLVADPARSLHCHREAPRLQPGRAIRVAHPHDPDGEPVELESLPAEESA
jgi:hypothetical protein